MKKILMVLITPFFVYSQSKPATINPRGKWYFGVQVGMNDITSFEFDEGSKSISVGLLSEYYFAKQWSIQARVKYMKTGLSFLKESANGIEWPSRASEPLLDTQYPFYNRFDGHTIVIPIDIKWEFRLYQNLHGNLKMGPAINIETKSTYNYTKSNSSSTFVNLNLGYGLQYYLSEKYSVGVDLEHYAMGESKGSNPASLLWNEEYYATNAIYSLQIKYHF